MEPRVFFIVNPNSDSGRTKKHWHSSILPNIKSFFPTANWAYSSSPAEASAIALLAKNLGYSTIVAVGGDGTINEVVNGILNNLLITPLNFSPKIFNVANETIKYELTDKVNLKNAYTPQLGILPTGTGCDFIKSLNIPRDITKAIKVISKNSTIKCDTGLIEYTSFINNDYINKQRYFMNIGGCGANGETTNNLTPSLKSLGQTISFYLASLKTLLINNHHHVQIQYDDEEPININLRVLFVCNGQYCGGGMLIAKEASLTDGLFHIVSVKNVNRFKTISLMNRLYSGDFSNLEDFIVERTAKKVMIISRNENPVLVECDGEQPGILPVTFSIIPKSIAICS